MSKRYRQENNTLNILLVILMLLTVAPVIPISLILIIVFYLFNIKGKYILITSSTIAILYSILFFKKTHQFIIHIINMLSNAADCILKGNIVNILTNYKIFDISDWFLILALSGIVSGYFLVRISKRKKREFAGIKNIDFQVDEMSKSKNDYTNVSCNGIFVGKNQNKRKIFLEDNSKHVFIAGTTGAGKTVLLSNFIKRAALKNYGALIVDGKGDMGEGSIHQITQNICNKLNKNYTLSI